MNRRTLALYSFLFAVAFAAPICLAVTDFSYNKYGAKINSTASDGTVSVSSGTEMSLYGSGCFTLNSGEALFVPTKTSSEWDSFRDWAAANPNMVSFGPCAGSCGNGACDAGESCGSCPGDCGACGGGGSCSSADLVLKYDIFPADPICASNGCSGSNVVRLCYSADPANCSDPIYLSLMGGSGCTGCPIPTGSPSSSTPYLFTMSGGKYYVEVDVMETYRDQYYEVAKDKYEHDSGDPLSFRQEDYYKLKLKPDVSPDGLKFLIKEIEPEESHIDQVRMIRVVHGKDTYVFVDQQSDSIKAVQNKQPTPPAACTFEGTDCLQAVAHVDNAHIEASAGKSMSLEFDLTGLDRDHLYLRLDAWENQPMPLQPAPFKAQALSLVPWVIIDPDHPETAIQLKHLHPRQIKSGMEIGLGDALKSFKGNRLVMKIGWTAHHFIDFAGLLESKPAAFRQEELPLVKALHSDGTDDRDALLAKDKVYAHTVRGDQIELTFASPREGLKDNEAETYFFAASGFYHGLRTYLYPKADASEDSFRRELKTYVDELNGLLETATKENSHEGH